MKRNSKLIAVMMVALMSLSVCGVTLSATPVSAAYASQIVAFGATNYAPLAGQSFTIYGWLLDAHGNPIPVVPVDIWMRIPGQAVGTKLATVTTTSGGYFEKSDTELQPMYYRAVFNGDAVYAPCKSALILVNAGAQNTALTIYANPAAPATNQLFAIYGRLTDSNGNGLPGRQIDVWWRDTSTTPTQGKLLQTTTTAANGWYLVYDYNPSAGTTYYRAHFGGELMYRDTLSKYLLV